MARADKYMSSLLPGANKTVVRNHVLTPVEALSLQNGLLADSADFYYAAWITFLDAVNGLNKGFYTWATVKLYYSVFYAFRASLAQSKICAFHLKQSSFTVDAVAGMKPVSCTEQGTHKTVLKTFQRRFATHPLVSQQIGLDDAVDWLMKQREAANYNRSRFTEQECGDHFNFLAGNGLRVALNAYLNDHVYLYTFDPDHAILAYPVVALRLIGNSVTAAASFSLESIERDFLKQRARDHAGSLPLVLAELKRLGLV